MIALRKMEIISRAALYTLLLLVPAVADMEVSDFIIPVKVYFFANPSKEGVPPPLTYWITYSVRGTDPVFNQLRNNERPVPGAAIYYVNKLSSGDSLEFSRKLYYTTDSIPFLIKEKMPYSDIRFIVDASSETLHSIGVLGNFPWVDSIAGYKLLKEKPLKSVTVGDGEMWSYRLYIYDKDLSVAGLRSLIATGSGEPFKHPKIQQAISQHKLIAFEVANP